MSLEMLLYVALAGLSIAFALRSLGTARPYMLRYMHYYEAYGIAQGINQAILSGLPYSSFNAYIPRGMCNSTASGNELHTPYGDLPLMSDISLNSSALCAGNANGQVSVYDYQGRISVG
jgi:hypothetical protein